MQYPLTAAGLATVLLLSACADDAPESADSSEQGEATDTDVASDTEEGADVATDPDAPVVAAIEPGPGGGRVDRSYGPADVPPELSGIVDLAIDDLVARMAVDRTAVSVLRVEEVVWADSSYGCSVPGMAYVPGNADGLRIVLGVDGDHHEYRLAGGVVPVFCDPVAGLPLATSASTAPADTDESDTEADGTDPTTTTTAAAEETAPDDTTPEDGDDPPADESDDTPDVVLIPDEEKGDQPTEGLNPPDE